MIKCKEMDKFVKLIMIYNQFLVQKEISKSKLMMIIKLYINNKIINNFNHYLININKQINKIHLIIKVSQSIKNKSNLINN